MEKFIIKGQELTLADIKSIASGKVTDSEARRFALRCQATNMSPVTNEIYLIGGKKGAKTVVAKDTFLQRGQETAGYRGFRAGVITKNKDTHEIKYRIDAFYSPGTEVLVGGWCEIAIQGLKWNVRVAANLREYRVESPIWKSKPATMIRKVAIATAFREAFASKNAVCYDPSEMGDLAPELADDDNSEILDPDEDYSPEEILEAVDSHKNSKVVPDEDIPNQKDIDKKEQKDTESEEEPVEKNCEIKVTENKGDKVKTDKVEVKVDKTKDTDVDVKTNKDKDIEDTEVKAKKDKKDTLLRIKKISKEFDDADAFKSALTDVKKELKIDIPKLGNVEIKDLEIIEEKLKEKVK